MQAPLMAFDGLRSHHDPQDVAHLRSTWRSSEASLLEGIGGIGGGTHGHHEDPAHHRAGSGRVIQPGGHSPLPAGQVTTIQTVELTSGNTATRRHPR
jgi:hypothetical protein